MRNQKYTWLINDISNRFHDTINQAIEILRSNNMADASNDLEEVLALRENGGVLRVAFVGQYSAGKSTIISALTGNRDIRIHADIATDCATDYDWNGIKLTDTPGLHTERRKHDVIAQEAIRLADLIVYVITSDLFNPVTLSNFKDLVFVHNYKHKIMLVVNKMSMEDGRFDELRANYLESITESLRPHGLDDIPVVFVDAADYLEAQSDLYMLEQSHFDDLVLNLNKFVQNKGCLGRLDQPIREATFIVESAQTKISTEISGSDDTRSYLVLLDRIGSRALRSRRQSELIASTELSQMRHRVIEIGSRVAGLIGQEDVDAELAAKEAYDEIKRLAESTSLKLEELLQAEMAGLATDIREVLESDLAMAYFSRMEQIASAKAANIEQSDIQTARSDFESLQSITYGVSRGVLELIGPDVPGLLTSSVVAGSPGHQIVYSVGKFMGMKFRPWQAVNIAKNIGNVAKMVSPILAIIGLISSSMAAAQEAEREREIQNARGEYRNSVIETAGDLERCFTKELAEWKDASYGTLLSEISEKRQECLYKTKVVSDFQRGLGAVLEDLAGLVTEIEEAGHTENKAFNAK